MSTLVSVIIPTRNRAELLRRSVRSVLAQTHADLEVIVVDDASTDHTRQVLDEFDDPRLRRIHRTSNRGAAAARNEGIAAARGELVAFNDDDDVWLVGKLERQITAMREAGVEWCLCGFISQGRTRAFYVGGPWYWGQLDYRRGNGRDIRDGSPDWSLIATPSWLVTRAALERAGLFDERIRSYDDWELGLRLDRVCRRVHLDEALFVQDRTHGGGLIMAEAARAADLRLITQIHGTMWDPEPRVSARHLYVIGHIETLNGSSAPGRRALLASIRAYPWDWRPWVAWALSFAPAPQRRRLFSVVRQPLATALRLGRRALRVAT